MGPDWPPLEDDCNAKTGMLGFIMDHMFFLIVFEI